MKLITSLLLLVSVVACGDDLFAWEYQYNGHLDNSAVIDQHPDRDFYHLTEAKTLNATIVGEADFDLYLYTYNNGIWTEVAKANSDEWSEFLSFNASEGLYAWFVVLKSPNSKGGDYTLMLSDF